MNHLASHPKCTFCEKFAVKRVAKGVIVCQEHFVAFKRLQHEQKALFQREKLAKHPYLRRIAKYGLSAEEYLKLIHKQKGHCPICWRRLSMPPRGKKRGEVLVVDHDHKTGNVRGLLCGKCNTAIGLLGDDPQKLERAIAYLQGLTKFWERDTVLNEASSETVPPTVM